MKTKKNIILNHLFAILSFCSSLCLCIISKRINSFKTIASPISYGITLNSTKNKFHSYTGNTAYSGDTTIQTDLGNDIGFSYSQVKGLASTWHVLGDGGYFYNTDPIHGIESIVLKFKTDSANFTIYYSDDDSFNHSQSFVSSSSSATIYDFSHYVPNYFKIVNDSGTNFNISSIDITLSCLNNYPQLTLINDDETMGSISGGGTKVAGNNVTVVATPYSGYRFVGWYSGSTLLSTEESYSFVIGNDDLIYSARFTYNQFNLVVQSEDETKGSVSYSSGSYDYLTSITISASANDGYSFAGWYEGSTFISGHNPYTFNMPDGNKIYTAVFSTNSYNVSLTNDNPTLGNVSGVGNYLYGSNVTVVATPNTGVSFIGWYNENDERVSVSQNYTFSMPYNNVILIAKFVLTPYEIQISVDGMDLGSVFGYGSYTYGQQVNLIAAPNDHCSFFGWYDGITLLSQQKTMTFDMPAQSLSYTAKFVHNYSIYVYSDDESMGSVSAPSEWGEGLEVTVNSAAKVGYALDYWYDDDLNEVSHSNDYTFMMPNHDIVLYASFTTGYTLMLFSNDNEKGIVSGGGQYKVGRTVAATMSYSLGPFKGWYDTNGNLVSNDNTYIFTMPSSDYTLIATFMNQTEGDNWYATHGGKPIIDVNANTITYGLYPQKNISDSSLISALNSLTMPQANGWYLYDNDYYAKLTATPFKTNYKFDSGKAIINGTTYWFKCEPILWNVLSNDSGKYYVVSSVLLDAHCYYNSTATRIIGGATVYPNNYEYSDVRTWLNVDFFNSAFALGNEHIQTTIVDNGASTTESDSNQYVCNNTQDKIFLPSYQDYINSAYGFSTTTNLSNTRCCITTDWARARGAYYTTNSSIKFNGAYWNRSPKSNNELLTCLLGTDGRLYYNDSVESMCACVRPALNITLS